MRCVVRSQYEKYDAKSFCIDLLYRVFLLFPHPPSASAQTEVDHVRHGAAEVEAHLRRHLLLVLALHLHLRAGREAVKHTSSSRSKALRAFWYAEVVEDMPVEVGISR